MNKILRLDDFAGARNAQAREQMSRVAALMSAVHPTGVPMARRVRIVGPTFSGKTFLTACTASEAGVEVLRMSAVLCGMSGDVAAKFAEARDKGGSVILSIDDGDMLDLPGMELVREELIRQLTEQINDRVVVFLHVTDDELMNQSLRSRFGVRVEVFCLDATDRAALVA